MIKIAIAKNSPLLLTLALAVMLLAPVQANAASIGLRGATDLWPEVRDALLLLGSASGCGCLITAVVKGIGRDWGEALMYAAGAAALLFVVGHAVGWTTGITGVTL
jgi:hypothetical protein